MPTTLTLTAQTMQPMKRSIKAGDTYTITAGGVVFTAQWEARTDTPYTVEHYLENLDGSYALDTTEPLKGTTDTTVTAAAKSYDNFTYDSTVPGTGLPPATSLATALWF